MYSETGGTTKKRAEYSLMWICWTLTFCSKESGSGQYGSVVCRVATASDEESVCLCFRDDFWLLADWKRGCLCFWNNCACQAKVAEVKKKKIILTCKGNTLKLPHEVRHLVETKETLELETGTLWKRNHYRHLLITDLSHIVLLHVHALHLEQLLRLPINLLAWRRGYDVAARNVIIHLMTLFQLSNICSKGSIIPVSFLNLNYMPADCLLGSEKDENDIFTEICGCQVNVLNLCVMFSPQKPIRGNRELQNVSELNNSVTNLMKSLAFHRARQKEVPMNAKEVEQNRRIVSELTTSIRTILQV